MRALGGKFTSTARLHRGCDKSEACHLCQKCCSYDKFSAKCHDCYPDKHSMPDHCLCGDRHMDKKAYTISSHLDTPLFDVNGRNNGAVEYHKDPLPGVLDTLGEEYQRRNTPIPTSLDMLG